MLRLHMLPAGHGDCLWIEYGDPENLRRILIDGGTKGTYRRALLPKLRALSEEQRRFELFVVTHIDADHIGGAVELLADPGAGFRPKEIWFNGFRHLPQEPTDTLGPVQGEMLTDLILRSRASWNGAFGKRAAVVPPSGALPRVELEGGLVLTLLSPTPDRLASLKPQWEAVVRKAGLDPLQPRPEEAEMREGLQLLGGEGPPDVDALVQAPFSEDNAAPNGSSIAMLAEFEGRRILLSADSHPGVLKASLDRLSAGGRTALDACKLSHHGSKANTSPALLRSLDCPIYLFSTNGAYFKHPDREAVARVIKLGGAGPALKFNYRTDYNAPWDSRSLREKYGYSASFPPPGEEGLMIEWS
ncbi:MAG TPA: MBL fold metallo-hydrolase [Thermoanaerobaculia bacterium]|nr:MBL fold metallo-hydrolase [Thermoanaerobaculia bacterium]